METPIVKNKDEQVSERLKKMVAPFILRRLKGDVLSDLPDKLEEIRYAKLEMEQQTGSTLILWMECLSLTFHTVFLL